MDEKVREKYKQGGGSSNSIQYTIGKGDAYEDTVSTEELSNEIAINHHGEVTAATVESNMKKIVEEAIEEYGGGGTSLDLSSYSSPISGSSTAIYSSKLVETLIEDQEEEDETDEDN